MKKTWFITGTDTNIGKTIISAILLKQAAQLGYKTAGYKPIATGSINTIDGLRNYDALLLKKNSNVFLKYNQVNPFFFKESVPPNFLIKKNNNIQFKQLIKGLNNIKKRANWIIIEGIGGWKTPLSNEIILSDWIIQENIPIILVIGIKLGCINHAILTNIAIQKSGQKIYGWFANCCIENNTKLLINYINTIKLYINAPFLGMIPYIKNLTILLNQKHNIILPT